MQQAVLITGASSGIGLELAKIFGRNGYNLVLASKDAQKLEKAKKQIIGTGTIITIPKDLSEPRSAKELYRQIKNAGFEIEILVNNAGVGVWGKFHEQSIEKVEQMLRLNIVTLTSLTHLFLQDMIKNRRGKILNVASIAGFFPGPLMTSYYASKAYVLHFSEALSKELEGTGITITTLCPGATETNFYKAAGAQYGMFVHSMSAEKVAQAGYDGLMKNKKIIIPGLKNKLRVFATRFLPRKTVLNMVKKRTSQTTKN